MDEQRNYRISAMNVNISTMNTERFAAETRVDTTHRSKRIDFLDTTLFEHYCCRYHSWLETQTRRLPRGSGNGRTTPEYQARGTRHGQDYFKANEIVRIVWACGVFSASGVEIRYWV
jgi:hypothetical protein